MKEQIHILNGDALLGQFPGQLSGDKIVMRECFMDGELHGKSLSDFYKTRINFLNKYFHVNCENRYYSEIVTEFEKIQQLKDSEVNLWFEDDLFCQVNMWFIISLLHNKAYDGTIYLVRPNAGNAYNFGAMHTSELLAAYKNRTPIDTNEIKVLADLWYYFKAKDNTKLRVAAKELHQQFPFLLPAVEAHLQRNLENTNPGRPEETLKQIISELKTTDFAPVFREFCKREAIYGFGDLQVKKMLETLLS